MIQTEKKTYSLEEYFEQELVAETRSEFRDGDIIPMTGGTPEHNEIAGNLYILLKSALKGQNYRTFYVDQRLWIPAVSLNTYPDVLVVSKPLEFQAGRTDTLTNACFIAEVLSKSTRNYDRGEKFVAYRTIPSFQEYLLIDQYQVHVEHHLKTGANQWVFSEYRDLVDIVSLNTFNLKIQVADLYETIEFTTG
jgi:Uma2 family endonuclease